MLNAAFLCAGIIDKLSTLNKIIDHKLEELLEEFTEIL